MPVKYTFLPLEFQTLRGHPVLVLATEQKRNEKSFDQIAKIKKEKKHGDANLQPIHLSLVRINKEFIFINQQIEIICSSIYCRILNQMTSSG